MKKRLLVSILFSILNLSGANFLEEATQTFIKVGSNLKETVEKGAADIQKSVENTRIYYIINNHNQPIYSNI